MIGTTVVILTVLMAAGFLLAFLLKPAWRARIEQPKHCFQEQLQQYDSRSKESYKETS